ncbi:MAG: S8 family serine peptidase [Anaerolineales bacterium]
MKRRLLSVLVCLILLLASAPLVESFFDFSPVSVDSDAHESFRKMDLAEDDWGKFGLNFVPDELIVKFKEGVTAGQMRALRFYWGFEEVHVSGVSLARRWKVPSFRSIEEWADLLRRNPLVEYAEPNFQCHGTMVPDDPLFGLQWHLDNDVYGGINMKSAWDIKIGDEDVVVAIVDSGVAFEDSEAPAYWHIDTYRAYSGHSWWCGVSAAPAGWTSIYGFANSAPGYGNNWREFLQHEFDLSYATGTVTFSYVYRYHLENGQDYAYVEVSTDEGLSWIQLASYTGPSSSSEVEWSFDSVDLTAYKGGEVLVRFRVFTDRYSSDEDGLFDSDGAFFVDEISLQDEFSTIFYDDVESGSGFWKTTYYEQAPDLAGTSFWVNEGEIADDGMDNDGNGFVDDVSGWDFVNLDNHPNDDGAHGTHVAGTVAQTTNNGLGVAGVAFGVTIMPVKVLCAGLTGTLQQVADGIYYAVDNGADIISLSLGFHEPTSTLEEAVAYAYSNDVTVIAAAGNYYSDTCIYPAAYNDYVIAVGATQYDETKTWYSNYGSSLDVVAPGGNTDVDQNFDGYPDGVLQMTFGDTPVDWEYVFYMGTSMATPHVSGVAALLLSLNPTLTPDQIRNALESTAKDLGDLGRDYIYGWGLVDAASALQSIPKLFDLTLAVSGSGSTSPAVGVHAYEEGAEVAVAANAASGWEFDHWQLDSENVGSSNPYTVTMNADHTLTAVFVEILPEPLKPVHLVLFIDHTSTTYMVGDSLSIVVNVFNKCNPPLNSTLTLTVTGPKGYYHYDFEPIIVAADEVWMLLISNMLTIKSLYLWH